MSGSLISSLRAKRTKRKGLIKCSNPSQKTLLNGELFKDPETREGIRRSISRTVTDDYGNVWYSGGIKDPGCYVIKPSSFVARISLANQPLGSWVMNVGLLKKLVRGSKGDGRKLFEAWCKSMNIAASTSMKDLNVYIFQIKYAIGAFAGGGLPVGNDYNLRHVDEVGDESTDVQYYLPGVNPGEGGDVLAEQMKKNSKEVYCEDLAKLANQGPANIAKYS